MRRLEAKYEEWRSGAQRMSDDIHTDLETCWAVNELFRDHADDIHGWTTLFSNTRLVYFERAISALWAIAVDRDTRTASIRRIMDFVRSNRALFSETAVAERVARKYGEAEGQAELDRQCWISRNLITPKRLRELDNHLTAVKATLANITGWRHNRLAHLNLQVARGRRDLATEFPLAFDKVQDVFCRCGRVWNTLSLGYDLTELKWGVATDVPRQIGDLVGAAIRGTEVDRR